MTNCGRKQGIMTSQLSQIYEAIEKLLDHKSARKTGRTGKRIGFTS